MQFIGGWMKANFTYGFCKTIWNLVESLKVMLIAGRAWHVAGPPYFNITLCHQSFIWMPLQGGGVKISISTHTRSGSTMINTPWYAKINAQELFYFMILPVEGTLIDLAVSMRVRLEFYTDAHGTLIFDNYDHHHHCVRPLVSGGLESLVGRAVQGCCVVHVVVFVDPSLCIGWLWSWSEMYLMLVAVVFRLLVL